MLINYFDLMSYDELKNYLEQRGFCIKVSDSLNDLYETAILDWEKCNL